MAAKLFMGPSHSVLFVANSGLLLDGVDLEGRGVEPDMRVDYPIEGPLLDDPQMAAALRYLSKGKPTA